MPLDAFSQDLWERMNPSYQAENENGGLVQVWCVDPKDLQRGEFSTLNFSAWPNDASVCSLSQVLERGSVPAKYCLSPKACAGILRRAGKRGKILPELLRRALEQVAG